MLKKKIPGGWVKMKLKLPHFHVRIRYMCVSLTRRSRCNSSSRCWYRARKHVDPTWSRNIRCVGDIHPETPSSPGIEGLGRTYSRQGEHLFRNMIISCPWSTFAVLLAVHASVLHSHSRYFTVTKCCRLIQYVDYRCTDIINSTLISALKYLQHARWKHYSST